MDVRQKRSLGIRIALVVLTVAWLASNRFGLPGEPDHFEGEGRRVELEILKPYKGKVILVNLFATWCGPCIAEMPDLVKLQAAHPGLAVVGLQVMDIGGEPLDTFGARLGVTYPLIDANDNPEVEKAFGSPAVLPMSYILDKDGRIAAVLTGRTRLEEFEQRLALYF